MKIIKELRKYHQYTQADLANRLNVTQQTIAKWESGKTEPTLANLRDLALALGTSVDELLNKEQPKTLINHTPSYFGDNPYGFWGHIGIGLPNQEKSLWYPITLHDANRLSNHLYNLSSYFMGVDTLNGRSLYINKNNIEYIRFLPDSADQIDGDWELNWDSYQGYPADIYPALADYLLDGYLDTENYSSNFIQVIKNIASENEHLSLEDIQYSHIYTLNKHHHHTIYDDELLGLMILEDLIEPEWFNLGNTGDSFDMFISSEKIVLIDVPTYLLQEAIEREQHQYSKN